MLSQEKKQIIHVLCLTNIDNSVTTTRGSGGGGLGGGGQSGVVTRTSALVATTKIMFKQGQK